MTLYATTINDNRKVPIGIDDNKEVKDMSLRHLTRNNFEAIQITSNFIDYLVNGLVIRRFFPTSKDNAKACVICEF